MQALLFPDILLVGIEVDGELDSVAETASADGFAPSKPVFGRKRVVCSETELEAAVGIMFCMSPHSIFSDSCCWLCLFWL